MLSLLLLQIVCKEMQMFLMGDFRSIYCQVKYIQDKSKHNKMNFLLVLNNLHSMPFFLLFYMKMLFSWDLFQLSIHYQE